MDRVHASSEYARVCALPRRDLPDASARQALADVWTRRLACADGVALRPWQGLALDEASRVGGAVLALPVGVGKTLVSVLAPTAMGAQRAVLVVPGSLRDQTLAAITDARRSWRVIDDLRVITREALSHPAHARDLDDASPDVIVIDEADTCASMTSAAAVRITRYLDAHPETRVVVMTGTLARRALSSYAALLWWSLGDHAPVPSSDAECDAWSEAMRERGVVMPGALGRSRAEARAWYRDRLAQTPGVVLAGGDSCDTGLTLRLVRASDDEALDAAYAQLALSWALPDGEPIADMLAYVRTDRTLGCGYYAVLDPPPPIAWLRARRALAAYSRAVIARSQRTAHPVDTEGQVLREHAGHPVVRAWQAVRGTYTPTSVPRWVSDVVVRDVVAWAAAQTAPAIVWCGSVPLGEAVAGALGVSWLGLGSRLPDIARGVSVASWHAHGRGRNAQRWHRALVVDPPQSARDWEQLLGRMHRAGQTHDVSVDVLITSAGTEDRLAASMREAVHVRDTTAHMQKILIATQIDDMPVPSQSWRWGGPRSTR